MDGEKEYLFDIVTDILDEDPESRGNDWILAVQVWERQAGNCLFHCKSIGELADYMGGKPYTRFDGTEVRLYSVTSITRIRRLAQSLFPWLRPEEKTSMARKESEEDWKEQMKAAKAVAKGEAENA